MRRKTVVHEHLCPFIQNVLASRTCDQYCSFLGSQALLKNHCFLLKTKRKRKIKAKKVLYSRKNDVLVVLDDEKPEWMSTEDVEITPLLWRSRRGSSSASFYAWRKLFNVVGIIFRWFRKKKKIHEPESWKTIKNEYNTYFIYTKLARVHLVRSVKQTMIFFAENPLFLKNKKS